MVEITELILSLTSLLPSESVGYLQKLLDIPGGIELLSRVVNSSMDSSEEITEEDITKELEGMKFSGKYGW